MSLESATNPYAAPASHEEKLPASGGYHFLRKPRFLTNLLVILMAAHVLKGYLVKYDFWDIPFAVDRKLLTGYAFAAPTLFLMWVHRAARNSRGFGARDMRISPCGAIGWYFVPIMNFFRPYQAMKEIWQVSGDPDNWRSQPAGFLLIGWWTTWILHTLHAYIFILSSEYFPGIAEFRNSFGQWIVGFTYPSVHVMAVLLILTITRRQEALVARSVEQA